MNCLYITIVNIKYLKLYMYKPYILLYTSTGKYLTLKHAI